MSDPNLLWNVAIGVRKNDHDLREVLNVVLGELAAEQRVPQLMSQYGVSYTPPWGEDRFLIRGFQSQRKREYSR